MSIRERRKLRGAEKTINLLIAIIVALLIAIVALAVSMARLPEGGASPIVETMEPAAEIAEPEPAYSWDDVETLARLIYWEAGDDTITDRHQQLVACVALNRVASPVFPDTLDGVIAQPGQYAVARQVQAGLPAEIPARCVANAILALNGSVDCPPDVVYQAEFQQGAVYEVHTTSYSTTYFCH